MAKLKSNIFLKLKFCFRLTIIFSFKSWFWVQEPYGFTHMWDIKQKATDKTNKLTDTDDRVVVTGGGGGAAG